MEKRSKWIPIKQAFPLPTGVKKVFEVLDDAGFVTYLVGGCVRDFLLGRSIKDYDLVTQARPDEAHELFPKAIDVGKAFGVLKVPTVSGIVEVATFREDLDYQDFRRPRGVKFSGPEEDAARRDFTVNALFYDPKTQRILDFTEGVEDLKKRVLRAIGPPEQRFREDALRLLRAVRFSKHLDFSLEAETERALTRQAHLIRNISAERVREELSRMWLGPQSSAALSQLKQLGLLQGILSELAELEKQSWEHTVKTLAALTQKCPGRSLELSWAAVLIDVAQSHRQMLQRLKFSVSETERIGFLLENSPRLRDVFQMREATLQRFIRHENFEEVLALHEAEALARDGNLAFHEFCRSRYEQFQSSGEQRAHKLITGEDLIQLGLSPGPSFTGILESVEDLALEKKLSSKEEALEYVIHHFVK